MDSDSDQESFFGSADEEFSSSESESENDDSSLDDARVWCRIDPAVKGTPPPKFPFSANPGLKVVVMNHDDPVEYFNLFFDQDILGHIVQETNRYASNHIDASELTPSSRSLMWEETDIPEMRKFIAILILQGIIKKPVERWFWSKRPILHTPIFGQIMTSQRYSLLMKFLHFEDNDSFQAGNHPNPKLRKIYDVHHKLIKKFKCIYQPERDICIDESLLGYKGMLGWKQYIPTKRARFGIKMYQLCESSSGYIWNSIIYSGKTTVYDEEFSSFKMSTRVVLTLAKDLLNQGYTLTTDNFYTSPELAEVLIKKKTDIYGTMRANRKDLPAMLKEKKLKKGEIISFQKGKMNVLKWQDKKPICLLSTIHGADTVEISAKKEKQNKPHVVLDYNLSMGGVDLADQCLSYYRSTRNQQRKYYKKIFRHLIDQAVWNSCVLFKKNGGSMSHANFRMQLIENLIQLAGIQKNVPTGGVKMRASENISRLTGRHFPTYVESSNSAKKYHVRKCVVCASKINDNGKRVRKETRFQCEDCNVGLCAAPCFKIYHTHQIF